MLSQQVIEIRDIHHALQSKKSLFLAGCREFNVVRWMCRISGNWVYVATLLMCTSAGVFAADTLTVRIVDKNGAPVPGAVVFLGNDEFSTAPHQSRVIVDQINNAFVPEVTVIQVGTEVVFPNSDAIRHHVYSFAQPNSFELPLYNDEQRPAIRFDYPGVVTLGCNIHDSMLGYIIVVDTPHYAMSDGGGNATLTGLNSKDVVILKVWSPRLDNFEALKAVEVSYAPDGVRAFQVSKKLRSAPKPMSGSLAWDNY